MKINAVGIDAYRQVQNETKVQSRQVATQKQPQTEETGKVNLPGQSSRISSKLAVKLKEGTFDDLLSTEEKKALEMMFDRFKAAGMLDGGYAEDGAVERPVLGTMVDVKL